MTQFKELDQEQLDELAAPLYRSLGRTLARWQHVETGMFLLAHSIMRTEYKYSSAIFYMLKGADMKLQLLDRLCRAHFAKDIIDTHWASTFKDLQEAKLFRNGLAHFEVSYLQNDTLLKNGDPPIALTSHHLDAREAEKPLVKAAMVTELNRAAEFYRALSQRLISLVAHHFSIADLRSSNLPDKTIEFLTSHFGLDK